MNKYLKQTEPK